MMWKLQPYHIAWSPNFVSSLTLDFGLVFGRMLQCAATFFSTCHEINLLLFRDGLPWNKLTREIKERLSTE